MIQTKYDKSRRGLRAYYHELSIIGMCAITLFVALSLISHNSQDTSFLYSNSAGAQCSNLCGASGAHIASFFFYLYGSSSLWIIALFIFCVYALINKRSLKHEWDRVVAFFAMMMVCATLSNAYMVDGVSSSYPGGLIGHVVKESLYGIFDQYGALIFLNTLFVMCTVLLARFSFIGLVAYCMRTGATLWSSYVPEKMMINASYAAFNYMSKPCVYSYIYVRAKLQSWLGSVPQEPFFIEYDNEYADVHTDAVWNNIVSQQPVRAKKNPAAKAQAAEQAVIKDQPEVPLQNSSGAPLQDAKPANALSEQEVTGDTYCLPNLSIFIGEPDEKHDTHLMQELEVRAKILEEKLERFGVAGSVVAIKRGPVVTLFEYKPDIDSKISKIISLEDDLALALQALSIRIIAPIPGRSVVGFEVANAKRKSVALAEVIQSRLYTDFKGSLPLILGKDTIGADSIVDLAAMPHLLIAGSTGSGKSVALNAMLVSLLCKCTPDELKLILIDPKRLEFSAYADIAHLLFPIVTNPKQAAPVLQWVVKEMEERYAIMAERGARNINDYNSKVSVEEKKPLIVVVIDELADLMMTAGRDIESLIARIAQMARAAGIHMMVATQRPSVDVITGLIKVNFPSRISFRVISKVDSRTILDCAGADKLLGKGDMLFLDANDATLKRIHGAYVSDKEIVALMDHIRAQRPAEYLDLMQEMPLDKGELLSVDDALYDDIVLFLNDIDEVSISLLQRKFRIGYNRSARIIELLEARGLVMPSEGGKTRKVVR